MKRIAIVEDERVERDYISSIVQAWCRENHSLIQIDCFEHAEQFIMECEDYFFYDMIFLDIQMGQMNGMELARKIREKNQLIKIVFLTGIRDYAVEGYEVEAVRYLIKPIKEEVVKDLLSQLVETVVSQQEEIFMFRNTGQSVRVKFKDIIYIEARGHYLFLKTDEEQFEWKTSLSSIAEELEKNNLFLCRRGLYVNLLKVNRIGRMECYLDNGECIPVSKSRYPLMNEAFIHMYRRNGV